MSFLRREDGGKSRPEGNIKHSDLDLLGTRCLESSLREGAGSQTLGVRIHTAGMFLVWGGLRFSRHWWSVPLVGLCGLLPCMD